MGADALRAVWDAGGAWALLGMVTLAIEGVAIGLHWRTLSRQVWKATDPVKHPTWHWLLPVLSVVGFALLFAHFFLGLWR